MVNSSVLTMMSAPRGRSSMLAFSAAGFIATSTSGASPGVRMSWSAKCSWKPDTPASVPAGARISAGKLGSVDRSLPKDRGLLGEPVTGQLHAVAGVAREPDDRRDQAAGFAWSQRSASSVRRDRASVAAATTFRSGAAPRRRGASVMNPALIPLTRTHRRRNLCHLAAASYYSLDGRNAMTVTCVRLPTPSLPIGQPS